MKILARALLTTSLLCSVSFTNLALSAEATHNPLAGDKAGINPNEPPEDAKWEAAWQRVCSYDEFCHRLKNPKDSNWYNPQAVSIEALRYYRDDILKAAKTYDVDPRAIVASFLADLTIIPIYEGDIHQFLVDKAAGKNPTAQFPLGLVYPVAAVPVEDLAAKIENRKPRDPKEIRSLLQTPVGTIYYGAAVIRDAQDRYKQHGFDIKHQIDVLATLYNLGKVDAKIAALEARIKRAKDMKAKGATDKDLARAGLTPDMLKPRFNFFGLFAQKNSALVDEILNPANDSKKNSSIDKSCPLDKTAAMAEFAMAQSVLQGVLPTSGKKADDFAKAINKKLSTPNPSDDDFAKAANGANATTQICPSSGNLNLTKDGNLSCSFATKTANVDTQATYTLTFNPADEVDNGKEIRAKPASLTVCYAEQVDHLSHGASIQVQSCASRDVGDQTSAPHVVHYAQRLTGAESFYGREAVPIVSDPNQYVSYAVPFQCYYEPKSGPGIPGVQDVRTQDSTQTKAPTDSVVPHTTLQAPSPDSGSAK